MYLAITLVIVAALGFMAGAATRDVEIAALAESRSHDAIEIEELGEMLKQCRAPIAAEETK